ncbi:diaminopimelate epimerase [Acidithiobacillus sp. IBUN Pt1247-S3]|uniref:diaminopimelate epimerase n=1 Tax=Acidithiobacillus sp. IBUN Pt1247-S3 TaxID=3166642 RepID=UPI0034E43758
MTQKADQKQTLAQAWAFTKMHGLGNDFVVLDGVRQSFSLQPQDCRQIADRHFGVGCDQILLVEPAEHPDCDFRYRIFNADGSEVNQCGNGARCFAVFVRRAGLSNKGQIRVETRAGQMLLAIRPDGLVEVDMGVPILEPAAIPFRASAPAIHYELPFRGKSLDIAAVSMGNPHLLLAVEDCVSAPVGDWGPELECHPAFPERCNVGFLEIQDRAHLRLRTWERGAGETLACGSNACAAVVAGQLWGQLAEAVQVTLPGGTLEIHWAGPGQNLRMIGPAQVVFDGTWIPQGESA